MGSSAFYVSANTTSSKLNPDTLSPRQTFVASSALAWLKKLEEGVARTNFRMSFVVLKPGVDVQPYLWRRGVDTDGVQFEQLSRLNGPGREMLRIGNKVSYFEPNLPAYSLPSAHINGPMPLTFFADPLSLGEAYEFILVGRSRISGKAAQHIRIVSRDKSRYSVNLWLDRQTGLPLKMNTVDLKGQVIEQIQTTDITLLDSIDPHFANIDLKALPEVVPVQRIQGKGATNLQLSYVPSGMNALRKNTHRLAISGHVVDYMLLTDGLVDVSVYVQRDGQASDDLLLRAQSETFLSRTFNRYRVTVIGKLPPETANAIAAAVNYGNGK